MTSNYIDPNEYLMGGGVPSAKFPNQMFGTTVSGRIVAQPEVTQQTDPADGKPKFWDNGDPKRQLVITIQTEMRDPSVPDDDGRRKLYVKGRMEGAVRDAVKASGAKLAVGGVLSVTYVADGERTKGAFNPPKIFTATYSPPATEAANAMLMGQQPAPAPQYAPAPQAAYVPPAPAQPAYVPPAPALAAQQAPAQYAPPVPAPAPAAQQAPAPAAVPGGVDPTALAAAMANLTPEQRTALGL